MIFIPKCRRKTLNLGLRQPLGELLIRGCSVQSLDAFPIS